MKSKYISLVSLMLGGLMPRLYLSFAEEGGEGGGDAGGDSGGDGGGDPGGGDPGGGEPGGGEPGAAAAAFDMNALRGGIPEEYRENPIFSKYGDDLGEFAKGVSELASLAGKKGDLPTDWADEQKVAEFWGKAGRPEDASGYEINLPENYDVPEPYLDKARAAAHKANMTDRQAKVFFAEMMEYEAGLAHESAEQRTTRGNASKAKLAAEWGDAYPEMEAETRNLMRHFDVPEEMIPVIETNTEVRILLGKMSQMLQERGTGPSAIGQTRAGVEAQFTDAQAELSKALSANGRNMNDPAIQPLIQRFERLQDKKAQLEL